MTGASWFWFGSRSIGPDDVAGPLGDDADDELGPVVDVKPTLALAMTCSPSTSATSSSRPKAGGWAYRTKVLSERVGRSTTWPNRVRPCEPPAIRSSPIERRTVVLDVDRDRHPRPDAGVPVEQGLCLHREAVGSDGRRRDQAKGDEREERGRHQRARATAVMRMSGGDGQAGSGMEAHEDSARGSACDGRSKDVSPRVKVA